MAFPTNDTNLSLAGVLKWLAIVLGCVALFRAYQSFGLMHSTSVVLAPGQDPRKDFITDLVTALVLYIAAFCLWFVWQRNED